MNFLQGLLGGGGGSQPLSSATAVSNANRTGSSGTLADYTPIFIVIGLVVLVLGITIVLIRSK